MKIFHQKIVIAICEDKFSRFSRKTNFKESTIKWARSKTICLEFWHRATYVFALNSIKFLSFSPKFKSLDYIAKRNVIVFQNTYKETPWRRRRKKIENWWDFYLDHLHAPWKGKRGKFCNICECNKNKKIFLLLRLTAKAISRNAY